MLYLLSLSFTVCFLGTFLARVIAIETKRIRVEIIINHHTTDLCLSFNFDSISLIFFSVVSLISRVVFLYRKFYIGHNPLKLNISNNYFFLVLMMFVISIFFLVFSNSWVLLIVGWDGLGLTSFLLVIFYRNSNRLDSGLITVLSNRIGDCLFILGFIPMLYRRWFFYDFFKIPTSGNFLLFSFIILAGRITKRAQFPFSSWLPAAIAAPTPVSSLVHSSTLVTAGVYVALRFNFLANSCFSLFSIISLATMVLAGVCAIVELDFKKVVAISTLSQIGLMFYSITTGYWLISFFHMVFHAFFKSCLFLATGNLIHSLRGDQDSRNFGSIGFSPFSSVYFSLRVIRLAGFPFSLGFYSKDVIIGLFSGQRGNWITTLFLAGCCFTVAYRCKLVMIRFSGKPSLRRQVQPLEEPYYLSPLLVIYTFCVFVGNFFFFDYIPPVLFSFFDFRLGIIVITLGVMAILIFSTKYITQIFFSSISFVHRAVTIVPKFLNKFPKRLDTSWGELNRGKGVALLTRSVTVITRKPLKIGIWISLTAIALTIIVTTPK